jgi:hypothetical protein
MMVVMAVLAYKMIIELALIHITAAAAVLEIITASTQFNQVVAMAAAMVAVVA